MTRDEIVAALRCISTLGDDKEAHCDKCPFRAKKKVDAELAVFIGGGELHYCDCEAILFAAADLTRTSSGTSRHCCRLTLPCGTPYCGGMRR